MEKLNNPKIENIEGLKKHKVLKVSEMALSLDGEYLGEIGNPSYREKSDMFEYDSDIGLLIKGTKNEAFVDKNDLVKVPHDLGQVTVDRLLSGKDGIYSGIEFHSKIGEIYRNIKDKIDKISFLAEIMDIEFDQYDVDFAIKKVAKENNEFTPEDLIEKVVEVLKEKSNNSEKVSEALDKLKNSGVLDSELAKNRDGIINYFYLYLNIKGIDASNSEEILKNGFEKFRFLDQLISEYKSRPDGRFGDALLVACSEQEKEWKKIS
ncbi:MAG: hypothetical protein UT05_C0005G0032 [Parcubacteria group bacterium GW2011_GWF2_38_76]|nr:MAG: hypothetical protein UT05_C0005G0032 [Parcubacteria group bacterium GW2011_GWF2_38_76]HBM45603.1 hypothetical protein [Patescibacteria group bacterium]